MSILCYNFNRGGGPPFAEFDLALFKLELIGSEDNNPVVLYDPTYEYLVRYIEHLGKQYYTMWFCGHGTDTDGPKRGLSFSTWTLNKTTLTQLFELIGQGHVYLSYCNSAAITDFDLGDSSNVRVIRKESREDGYQILRDMFRICCQKSGPNSTNAFLSLLWCILSLKEQLDNTCTPPVDWSDTTLISQYFNRVETMSRDLTTTQSCSPNQMSQIWRLVDNDTLRWVFTLLQQIRGTMVAESFDKSFLTEEEKTKALGLGQHVQKTLLPCFGILRSEKSLNKFCSIVRKFLSDSTTTDTLHPISMSIQGSTIQGFSWIQKEDHFMPYENSDYDLTIHSEELFNKLILRNPILRKGPKNTLSLSRITLDNISNRQWLENALLALVICLKHLAKREVGIVIWQNAYDAMYSCSGTSLWINLSLTDLSTYPRAIRGYTFNPKYVVRGNLNFKSHSIADGISLLQKIPLLYQFSKSNDKFADYETSLDLMKSLTAMMDDLWNSGHFNSEGTQTVFVKLCMLGEHFTWKDEKGEMERDRQLQANKAFFDLERAVKSVLETLADRALLYDCEDWGCWASSRWQDCLKLTSKVEPVGCFPNRGLAFVARFHRLASIEATNTIGDVKAIIKSCIEITVNDGQGYKVQMQNYDNVLTALHPALNQLNPSEGQIQIISFEFDLTTVCMSRTCRYPKMSDATLATLFTKRLESLFRAKTVTQILNSLPFHKPIFKSLQDSPRQIDVYFR